MAFPNPNSRPLSIAEQFGLVAPQPAPVQVQAVPVTRYSRDMIGTGQVQPMHHVTPVPITSYRARQAMPTVQTRPHVQQQPGVMARVVQPAAAAPKMQTYAKSVPAPTQVDYQDQGIFTGTPPATADAIETERSASMVSNLLAKDKDIQQQVSRSTEQARASIKRKRTSIERYAFGKLKFGIDPQNLSWLLQNSDSTKLDINEHLGTERVRALKDLMPKYGPDLAKLFALNAPAQVKEQPMGGVPMAPGGGAAAAGVPHSVVVTPPPIPAAPQQVPLQQAPLQQAPMQQAPQQAPQSYAPSPGQGPSQGMSLADMYS